ncbi:hypothetical protein [Haloparvum sedimenti]|uniref:hypothetical protein n=1 Tax=Haloparvum sedimenti TaxID=1678448 RepID=UPI000F77DD2E|nr:hypothetical protein [Haloparvum sedimenti]
MSTDPPDVAADLPDIPAGSPGISVDQLDIPAGSPGISVDQLDIPPDPLGIPIALPLLLLGSSHWMGVDCGRGAPVSRENVGGMIRSASQRSHGAE